jgi:putative ABC transport system ATP-binding protein
MIDLRQLVFRYPASPFRLVIDSLQIARGEKVAFVGPSGSGKTTLLNLIAGVHIPDSGLVRVAETEVAQLSDAGRRNFRIAHIGLVFQQFELLPYLRAGDNIRLPYLINPTLPWSATTRARLSQLAATLGISDKLGRFPSQLSQGEQQRVAIARALIHSPPVLLADEPTGNLDPPNKRIILELLFEQAASHDGTLVVVTHDLGILDGFDRVIDFSLFQQTASGIATSGQGGVT